ncbi:M16 family metallopeptidase [Qipengyuania atrilutea]|uniref:Insulinase family protein n=1 Tax=Qipengyuania atrilutea TaxID=2744473 RepID=A0A850H907_9SPHN|nr:pitrilysin family protein [Actirhodobacter atriluteus]NVD45765.1 insulinase family protein [Actirhodobacter atriluteus]
MLQRFLAASTIAIALATAVPLAAQDEASGAIIAPKIDYTTWSLDNGLRVIAIEDDTTASVTTSMWYDVGSKLDPEGRSGFAHLFEHILSRKTLNMPYNQIYGLTADVGGTRNASNGPDRTNYFETVPAEYLERMLWTHRERMAFPVVDDEVFNRERDVVKEELRQRVLAPPYGRFQRFVIPENAYDTTAYRRPGIGSIEELDAATLEDALAFHEAYYGPDTATLIVAGNFDQGNLRTLVEEYFADIPRRENPLPLELTAEEPERTEPRSIVARAPNVPLPVRGTLWKGPKTATADTAALEVLAAIMARGDNSRLNEALVRSGKAVDASFFYNDGEEAGMIAGFAITNPAADAVEVKAILDAEFARVRSTPVSADELAEAKNELLSSALRSRETARGRAFELGEAMVSTGDPAAADKRLDAISEVTIADVQRVATKWLDPRGRVDMAYEQGEENPAEWTNPAPFPTFRTLPEPTSTPLAVRSEGERDPLPEPGTRPAVEAPAIVERTLSNGIEVVAAQTGDVPFATMTVLVPGGSRSDDRAKAGVANMAAVLADKGAGGMSAQEIAARLESLGASVGATAGTDGSFFSLTAPAANMEEAGEVLAAMIRSADYPAEEFERERKRAIDGLEVSLKDPGALAQMVAQPVFYGDAPYGTLSGGTQESLAAITREDLLSHRRNWWHPAETKVIVSGGIAPEAAVTLADNLFGDWTSDAPVPPSVENGAGDPQSVRTVVVDMPDAGQAAVYAGVRAPSRSGEDYIALELANAVLGGGSSGRLFEEVRTKRSISYGAYSGLPARADDAYLIASSQTQNATADEVVQVFLDEFDRLGSEAFAADLIDTRRLYLSGGYGRSLETSSGFNSIVAELLMYGLEPSEAANYAADLQDITPEAASAAAAKYVGADKATVVVVGNAAEFIDDLRAIRPDVEVVKADALDLSRSDLGVGT